MTNQECIVYFLPEIKRDKERLKDSILEIKHYQNVEAKQLRDRVEVLHQDFRAQLNLLQKRFVREASDLSEQLKIRVCECKKEVCSCLVFTFTTIRPKPHHHISFCMMS